MRISFLAMSLSVALPSLLFSSAIAAPADPMKSLSGAGNWNEAIKQVEARFPKLIADELRKATKDLAYPTVRVFKGDLVITDSSGARITLGFKKDGVALLNGKPLEIKPLATADSEVNRIGSGDAKKVSLANYLLPDAFAGAGLGVGLAAIAYIGADNWKADACAEDELTSKDLVETCPVMGVGMVMKVSAKEAVDKTTKPFKITGLKCPAENSGILEQLRKNEDGLTAKLRFKVVDGNISKFIIEAAEQGKGFEVLEIYDVQNPQGKTPQEREKSKKKGMESIAQAIPLLTKVCANPEHLKRFKELAESNRRAFAQNEMDEGTIQPSGMEAK